ncbi:glycosyltransferase family 9 protein [Hymenobacter sp. RP-2-7]|uniref:Glycosyltransferase family 9 protein n=1 Tax=Hymenobacter polaris TaxID=2682546 RepID=A0A7Y0AD06_9BACT|nr:glycosyltransferase family 9 protein [Hymenobacter polaris]NML65046.1 glycosyltransferase family 9 protein [Hymenobacter polaris]
MLLARFRLYRRQRRELPRRAALDRTDAAALAAQAPPEAAQVLVLRTDSIGDYLLFRPWLRQLAAEVHSRGQRLTLLANALWAPLAQAWDADCIDELLAVNTSRFGRDLAYRAEVLSRVGALGIGQVINPLHVREPALENFIRFLRAPLRIASTDANLSGPWFETLNAGYSHLLPRAPETRFEYVRNGEFFAGWRQLLAGPASGGPGAPTWPALLPPQATDEHLAQAMRPYAPLGLPASAMAAGAAEAAAGPYLVLFAGASARQKQWPPTAFAQLARQLHQHYGAAYRLVLAGSPADEPLGRRIRQKAGPAVPLDDRCGRTDLPGLAALLAGASLVASNDTAAAHFAVQAGTPTLVLLMGENYGKFFPYPPALLRAPCSCLFPPSQEARFAQGDFRPPVRDPAIQTITVSRALAAAQALLPAARG